MNLENLSDSRQWAMKSSLDDARDFLYRNISYEKIEEEAVTSTILIASFGDEPYEILKPIPVFIEMCEYDEYLAGFFDANIHTGGETEQEAFDNLRSLIIDFYRSLSKKESNLLGPEPTRQLAVLNEFMKSRNATD